MPPGREGTSFTYAFRTINAAARRADVLVRSSSAMPGTYMQTLTHTSGQGESRVMNADVDVPVFAQARNLTEQNRKFVIFSGQVVIYCKVFFNICRIVL